MPRPTDLRFALTCLLAAVLLLAGCGQTTSSGPAAPAATPVPHLVTPAAAQGVVTAYLAANSKAVQALSKPAEDAVESGVLRETDDAAFDAAHGQGLTSDQPVTAQGDVKVFVPAQTAYPALFLAEAALRSGSSAPQQQYLLFVQEAAGAPWTAEFGATIAANTTPLTPAADPLGYASLLPLSDAAPLAQSPAATLAVYASYLEEGNATSTTLQPGPFTDAAVRDLVSSRSTTGLQFAGQWSAQPPLAAFRLADGSALVLGAVQGVETAHRASGPVVQDQGRQSWGGLLAPGAYGSVHLRTLIQTVMVAPAKGAKTAPSVVAGFSATVSIDGSPCPPGGC